MPFRDAEGYLFRLKLIAVIFFYHKSLYVRNIPIRNVYRLKRLRFPNNGFAVVLTFFFRKEHEALRSVNANAGASR